MLFWAGFLLIALGLCALWVDRALAHFIYDHVSARTHKALDGITHYAKAGHWLAAAIMALIVAAGMRHFDVLNDDATQLINYSLAFIRLAIRRNTRLTIQASCLYWQFLSKKHLFEIFCSTCIWGVWGSR